MVEPRELLGVPSGTCRLITAWEAEGWELELWYERLP